MNVELAIAYGISMHVYTCVIIFPALRDPMRMRWG